MDKPKSGEKWIDSEGREVETLAIAMYDEEYVVFFDGKMWVCPLVMFMERYNRKE